MKSQKLNKTLRYKTTAVRLLFFDVILLNEQETPLSILLCFGAWIEVIGSDMELCLSLFQNTIAGG
ncbi:hypothetical protein [Bacillus testis]|uniref:hypothetical protein n=1 Tax=Bacillus testis TaxID=1622072 RepID=UPI00067E9D8D|nr:hypothetical protein [Bacillus testis]